jgi:hypothetical protein
MIAAARRDYIDGHAYVPEHMIHYVTAVSRTEPFLFDDFLGYADDQRLIFIGYPLERAFDEKRMRKNLEKAIKSIKPQNVALTAPAIPASIGNGAHPPSDHYYRLDLSSASVSQKVRNMLTRAGRDLSVKKNAEFRDEHRQMIAEFLKKHPVDSATGFIFNRIDGYLASSPNARVFDVRNERGELVGFDVADFTPGEYAFYMFNFSSDTLYIPGASDLLLYEIIQQAKAEGKRFINLGLGINAGVVFFKKKWGGEEFLPYTECLYQPAERQGVDSLFNKL